MADWNIFQPTDASKPIHQILSGIQRGGFYVTNDNDEDRSRQALLDALAAAGYPAPSPTDPVYVHRTDTGNLERNTGNGWEIYPEPVADTGWVDLTPGNGWTVPASQVLQVRRVGGRVFLRGEVYGGTAGGSNPVVTLGEQFRSGRRMRIPVGWGANITHIGVETDGRVWMGSTFSSTPGVSLEPAQYWAAD